MGGAKKSRYCSIARPPRDVLETLLLEADCQGQLQHGPCHATSGQVGCGAWRAGVFVRPDAPLQRDPSLWLLQRLVPGLHVGGKTALDWQGVRHYVSQEPKLRLYGLRFASLPDEVKAEVNYVMRATSGLEGVQALTGRNAPK